MIVIWEQEYDNCWIDAVISEDKFNEYIDHHKRKIIAELIDIWPYARIINIEKNDSSIDYQVDYGDSVVKMEWHGFNYSKMELDVFT